MTTVLRISFILFAIIGDDYKGVLVYCTVYVTSHDFRFLKCLGVLVESRIVICFIMTAHLAQNHETLSW